MTEEQSEQERRDQENQADCNSKARGCKVALAEKRQVKQLRGGRPALRPRDQQKDPTVTEQGGWDTETRFRERVIEIRRKRARCDSACGHAIDCRVNVDPDLAQAPKDASG